MKKHTLQTLPELHRIGVLKLLPKVHKLKTFIDPETWKILSSRPIRAAETDPMKELSLILKSLLQDLLKKFRLFFQNDFGDYIVFPILAGFEDFLDRISSLRFSDLHTMKTTLISLDFEDAYTNTSVENIQESVREITSILGLEPDHEELIVNLLDLVFKNSYFYTPSGLFKQTRGMPMGDVSFKDALDVSLIFREYKILKNCPEQKLISIYLVD